MKFPSQFYSSHQYHYRGVDHSCHILMIDLRLPIGMADVEPQEEPSKESAVDRISGIPLNALGWVRVCGCGFFLVGPNVRDPSD